MLKLYTDESPGLKVDPFVVMVLSIGFIISVVALHSEYTHAIQLDRLGREDQRSRDSSKEPPLTISRNSPRKGHQAILFVNESPRPRNTSQKMIARKTRQIKEHGVSDLAGFLHIQLLFYSSCFFFVRAEKAGGFCTMYTKNCT
jgi:hypothetical protein